MSVSRIISFLLFHTIVLSCGAQFQQPSFDSVRNHVYYLASNQLKGRNTGENGQRLAAEYIESCFKRYGLSSFNLSGYNHYYTLKRSSHKDIIVKSSNNILYWPWHFYFTSGYNHSDTINSQLVFIGYGSDEELTHLDIEGNALALLAENPTDAFQKIKHIAEEYGNETFFVIFPKKSKEVAIAWGAAVQLSNFTLPNKFETKLLRKVTEEWAATSDSLNIYYCSRDALRNFFMLSDTELELIASNNINSNNELLSVVIKPEISCVFNYNDYVESIEVENVAGYLKGIDTTKTIVVSAHYDHIGENDNGINYGADDNASGVSALLESARLMGIDVKNGIIPPVNILFVAFSGEEIGLLGSKAFVNDSSVDIDKIKLNINMDMIGRWDVKHEKKKDFVYLLTLGKKEKKLYNIVNHDVNLPKGFEVSNKPGGEMKMIFKYGSDHKSFSEKNIPVAVFFTGLHDDYHTPDDTPEKINYKNLTNITGIVYQYIYRTAEFVKN